MSTYQPDSDISKFNRSESTDWFDVDPETALVVRRALTISEQTDGAFDPTVGPLVKLWNFGPGKKEELTLPAEEEIAKRLEFVGADKLDVRSRPVRDRQRLCGRSGLSFPFGNWPKRLHGFCGWRSHDGWRKSRRW